MQSYIVNVVKIEPSAGKHLRRIETGEVFNGFIFIPESLSESDFDEITDEEYEEINTNNNTIEKE